jgi:PAS domain S-box-containing protein
MDEVVLACDEAGRILYANPAALRTHGVSATDQFEPQMSATVEAEGLRRLDGTAMRVEELPLHRALRERALVREQFVIEHVGGPQLSFYATAVPLRSDGRVVGAVVVARDITELMELDRLKDQFLAASAHELKTPVAIIKAGVQTLSSLGETKEGARAILERIHRGADRIERVVSDLLDVSQLQLGRFVIHREPLDLREVVEQVVARSTARERRLHVVLREGAAVPLSADRARISQVLVHLLSNTVRYSPAGADVEVEVREGAREAVVSVRDHGIGIPHGRQSRIFERFYRAHADTPQDRGGMGLGLYLAKQFVVAHGGRMWFESTEGVGSTFSFSLPR